MLQAIGRPQKQSLNNSQQPLNYSLLFLHNTLEKMSYGNQRNLRDQLNEEYHEAIEALHEFQRQPGIEAQDPQIKLITLVLAAIDDYRHSAEQSVAIGKLLVAELSFLINLESNSHKIAF